MNDTEIRNMACELLSDIAPETDATGLRGEQDIREALDLDSMDFLNFIIALNQRTERVIAEEDYPKLFTLDGIVAFLGAGGKAAK